MSCRRSHVQPRRAAEPPSDRHARRVRHRRSVPPRSAGSAAQPGSAVQGTSTRSRSARGAGAARPIAPARRACSAPVRRPTIGLCARRHDGAVRCRPVQVREQRPVQRAGLLHERGLRRLRDCGEPRHHRHAAARDRHALVPLEDHRRVRRCAPGGSGRRCQSAVRTRTTAAAGSSAATAAWSARCPQHSRR